ncbi:MULTISPECIES: YlbF family regulator [Sporosarcina]|uniref:YlbF family regulator n=1 Tax=Sporosarcina TaxID=1569 RepID=UPI00058C6756|nr:MULTISPECIES: YlbF family regulator [Sporosarcina]WJY27691.1 YlbF family regulator [Sporosarcina sp. 0.2-SM1T-5]
MAVNIYDDINTLESSLRATDEFEGVKEAIERVKQDKQALELFRNFREIQMTLQQKQMAGEEIQPDELEHAQKTAQLSQQNPKIMEMLEAEMKLSGIIDEINRILMKPVQDLYETMN